MLIRLKELRIASGKTQAELAVALDMAPSTVGMYEQGRREPDADTLAKIAQYFSVSIDYLLGQEASTNKEEYVDDIMEMYKDLPEDKKEQVKAFIKFQASQK